MRSWSCLSTAHKAVGNTPQSTQPVLSSARHRPGSLYWSAPPRTSALWRHETTLNGLLFHSTLFPLLLLLMLERRRGLRGGIVLEQMMRLSDVDRARFIVNRRFCYGVDKRDNRLGTANWTASTHVTARDANASLRQRRVIIVTACLTSTRNISHTTSVLYNNNVFRQCRQVSVKAAHLQGNCNHRVMTSWRLPIAHTELGQVELKSTGHCQRWRHNKHYKSR